MTVRSTSNNPFTDDLVPPDEVHADWYNEVGEKANDSLVLGTVAGTAKEGDYAPAAEDISDATSTGRALITATNAAAGRAAIGAGTSSLVTGTTTGTAFDGQSGATLAADLVAAQLTAINSQTGDYTLVATDHTKAVEVDKATPANVTVPPNIFSAGQWTEIVQLGAGQVTVVEGSGVAILRTDSLKTRTQNSTVTLRCRGTNAFILSGDAE